MTAIHITDDDATVTVFKNHLSVRDTNGAVFIDSVHESNAAAVAAAIRFFIKESAHMNALRAEIYASSIRAL